MRRLGLIGGMSFESSALYYRAINEKVRARLGGLHSADILMHSVDFQPIVAMQKAGRWDEAGRVLAKSAQDLERAGAECVMIGAVTMHIVAPAVEAAIGVPLLHIADATARRLAEAGCRRPLLLGTRYTMESGVFPGRMAQYGIETAVPDVASRMLTHDIIYDELCAGKVLDGSRRVLTGLIETAQAGGADSVIFGCTEIGMILDPGALPLPGFDCMDAHAAAAVAFALDGAAQSAAA